MLEWHLKKKVESIPATLSSKELCWLPNELNQASNEGTIKTRIRI